MSTSTAIAVSALAISASNSSSQRKELCKLTIDQFDNKTASIEQKQKYADCVDNVYPQTMSDPMIIIVKILIMCAFIGAGVGVWKARHEGGAIDYIMFGIMGLVAGVVIPLLIIGLIQAVVFLFFA